MRPNFLAAALTAAAVVVGGNAQADDAHTELEKRFAEGVKLANEGKFEEARNRFLEACAVLHTTNCPKNLAFTEEKLGMLPEATAHYREYIDDARSKEDPAYKEAEEYYRNLLGKVGELDFVSTTEGARVRVDGKPVGTTPITHAVFVTPGTHEIEAQWPLSTKKATVSSEAGKAIRVVLAPDGTTATASAPTKPGMIEGPKTEEVRPTAGWVVPGVLGGLGLVGLGVGLGFVAVNMGAQSDRDALLARGVCFDRTTSGCQAYQAAVDDANRSGTAAIVSLVAGGALLVAGLVAFVVWPKTTRAIRATSSGLGFAF